MNIKGNFVIGIDIGGTKCAVSLIRMTDVESDKLEDYVCVEKRAWPTSEAPSPEEAIAAFEEHIRTLLRNHAVQPGEVKMIGISCGGPLNSKQGLILSPPNLPGWDRVPIVQRLSDEFGIEVKLQNDANACAMAEWKFGAGRGLRNVVFLTFGTGMGAGLILDGKLYSGTTDMAGEVGHMRLSPGGPYGFGKNGSFEGYCSGGGIANLGKQLVMEKLLRRETVSFCPSLEHLQVINAETIGRAAQRGDPDAIEILRISGTYLGVGLSLLIDILNPEAIIIGSIFGRQYDLLWPAAKEILEKEALTLSLDVCRIVPAGLGEAVGDYAALAVALCP